MKAKWILFCLFFFLAVGSLFALDNSLEKYQKAEPYEKLLAVIKDGRYSQEEVKAAYEEYKKAVPTGYGASRGCYVYGLYLIDMKDKAGYKAILEEAEMIRLSLTDEFEIDTQVVDVHCLIGAEERTMSAGLKLTEVLKEYYEKWKDKEVYAILTEAWRYINTPNIAGGSNKKALEIFDELLPYEDSLTTEFRFSLYKGYITANYNKKNWKEAYDYCLKANELFPYEPELMEYNEKLKKKMK